MLISKEYIKQITSLYLNQTGLHFNDEKDLINHLLEIKSNFENINETFNEEGSEVSAYLRQRFSEIHMFLDIVDVIALPNNRYLVIASDSQKEEVMIEAHEETVRLNEIKTVTLGTQGTNDLIVSNLKDFLPLYYKHKIESDRILLGGE